MMINSCDEEMENASSTSEGTRSPERAAVHITSDMMK